MPKRGSGKRSLIAPKGDEPYVRQGKDERFNESDDVSLGEETTTRQGRDHDVHKGAVEDNRPAPEPSGHPGLDQEGLPNDITAIAQDALGANADKSQG
jgi:hypothetical protein